MSSSLSSINFAALNQALNRYGPIPLLAFGMIGNILNILVFTRKVFRNNSCVIFFLASSISDAVKIVAGLLARVLNGFGYDPSQDSSALCKLRLFTTYYSGYTAAWFIGLACVERYLTSSPNVRKRQLVTVKHTYSSIVFVLLFGCVVFGEQFYCIDSYQHLLGAPQSCYQLQQNVACQIADSLMQFLFEILAPALMMMVFGLLIVRNIHQRRLRVATTHLANSLNPAIPLTAATNQPPTQLPVENNDIGGHKQSIAADTNRTTQKRDAQLITMLLVQVVFFVFSSLPISIYKFYTIGTMYDSKSVLRKSVENTVFILSVLSLFSNNCVNFYIYTLSGAVFRKELVKILRCS